MQWNGNGYNHQQNGSYGNLADARRDQPGAVPGAGRPGLHRLHAGRQHPDRRQLCQRQGQCDGVHRASASRQPITQEHVQLQRVRASSTKPERRQAALICGGSATNATGLFLQHGNADRHDIFTIANTAGNVRPFDALPTSTTSRRPTTTSVRRRRTGSTRSPTTTCFPNVRVYGEFDFSNNTTIAQIAPGGDFFSKAVRVQGRQSAAVAELQGRVRHHGRQPVAADLHRPPQRRGRRTLPGHHAARTIRYVLGAKGDLLDNTWNYNFWWQSGRNQLTQIQGNYFDKTKIARSLDVVTDPATGQPVCASVARTAPTRLACRGTSSTSAASRRRRSITSTRRDSRTASRRRA